MNEFFKSEAMGDVIQAFSSDTLVVAIEAILPVRTIGKTVKSSHKYRQIASSIAEIGLVEPPVVCRETQVGSYLLLDGHLRIEALKDLGHTEVECLLPTDDEESTNNRHIGRLLS